MTETTTARTGTFRFHFRGWDARVPTEYRPATDLNDGDIYWTDGYRFRVENIRHGVEFEPDRTRSEWTAVAITEGMQHIPLPPWQRFGSAGNGLRLVAVETAEPTVLPGG